MTSEPIDQSFIQAVSGALAAFDGTDLLAGLAALQLVPENADQFLRLELVAGIAAALPPVADAPKISVKRLGLLLNQTPVSEKVWVEDPFENVFVEEMTFFGGSYRVFREYDGDNLFELQLLLEGIFLLGGASLSPDFLSAANKIVTATLLLSDAVALRAGAVRGERAVHRFRDAVLVPSSGTFTRLKQSATFRTPELEAVLSPAGLALQDLLPLIMDQGAAPMKAADPNASPLLKTPIVRSDESFVVALPSGLVPALRHALVCLAVDAGLADGLREAFLHAVVANVKSNLELLDGRRLTISLPGSPVAGASEAIFSLDRDKVIYVQVATDNLEGYDQAAPYQSWDVAGLGQRLLDRVGEVTGHLYSEIPGLNEVFPLIVLQPLGRDFMLPLPDDFEGLLLAAPDLEAMAYLEVGHSLLLRQYARASNRLRMNTHVLCFDQLDEFQLYRSNDQSYYLSDGRRPTMLTIAAGGAEALRREVVERYDRHAAPSPDVGSIVEVARLHESSRVPLYVPERRGRPAVLVEGLSLPVWIFGAGDLDTDARGLCFQFADMLGHWLWQCMEGLEPLVRSVSASATRVRVQIELLDPANWGTPERSDPGEGPLECSVTGVGSIAVRARPLLMRTLEGSDNTGERSVVTAVIAALARSAGKDEESSDRLAKEVVDQYVPIGMNKKIVSFNRNQDPRLDRRGLPGFPEVQAPEQSDLLDELGDHLRASLDLKEGAVPSEKRVTVINAAVTFFFERLAQTVATVSPNGLLEWLVAHHEAVVYRVAEHDLTTPTRMACFASIGDMLQEILDEGRKQSEAAVASRFLIEYVVAQPPIGLRPISRSVYDRLLALASEIVQWGMLSDSVKYDLAEISISMLASGRLGRSNEALMSAQRALASARAPGEVQEKRAAFARFWQQDQRAGKPAEAEALDAAATSEFGFSLTELRDFLVEIVNAGLRRDGEPKVEERAALTKEVAEALGWNEDQACAAFSLFSLSPRGDFFALPEGFSRSDVYPWRFNRGLSYLRRALLVRSADKSDQIVWGTRQVWDAARYLLALCIEGRLKAQSLPMKQFMSALLSEEAELFNDAVAELFETIPGLLVRRRVKKIGTLKIRGENGELGDIDVLVADQKLKRLRAVETKDLVLGRTPADMARELESLLGKEPADNSFVRRHSARVEWLRDHIQELVGWLGLPTGDWQVDGLVVLSQELVSPYLKNSPIPVLSIDRLRSVVEDERSDDPPSSKAGA